MSEKTKIEWCDSTLNFWSGCTKVSPGCANCYAETLSNRKMTDAKGNLTIGRWGKGAPRKLHESAFTAALNLNRKPWICNHCWEAFEDGEIPKHLCQPNNHLRSWHRRRIFSLSLADWLDPEVPIEWLARMLDTVEACRNVIWILCSKRLDDFENQLYEALPFCGESGRRMVRNWLDGEPPQHVILLASAENQAMADKRIPELLRIPAACRGLSLEPLLGPVDLMTSFGLENHWTKLNWLIIGGESGPGARPCNVEWIRSLVAQGKAAGVATFVKQLGARIVCGVHDLPRTNQWRDKKGGDWSEWPEDLRVREWPKGF